MTRASYEELEAAIEQELAYLWSELDVQLHNAINCTWSIGALNVYDRIVRLTLLIGPIDWREVSMTLVLNGTYAEVHKAMGVEVEEVPPEKVEEMRQWRLRQGVRR